MESELGEMDESGKKRRGQPDPWSSKVRRPFGSIEEETNEFQKEPKQGEGPFTALNQPFNQPFYPFPLDKPASSNSANEPVEPAIPAPPTQTEALLAVTEPQHSGI